VTEASSPGRAAPKIKSINVHANLLSQRLEERERLRVAGNKKLLFVMAAVAATLMILPWMFGLSQAASKKAATLEKTLASLKGEVTKLRESSKLIEPQVQNLEMMSKSRANLSAFLAQAVATMKAVGPDMVVANFRCDVLGGDMTITIKADSEGYGAAERFLEKARLGVPPDKAGFTTTRRSDLLHKGGVSFEFVKKVVVGS
jgi:hypothetical protein